MKEAQFETELIRYITTGRREFFDDNEKVKEEKESYDTENYLKKKLWKYEPHIKTTEDLWNNFKDIVERLNKGILNYKKLSETEFAQVKKKINELRTPYQAGKFLYGHNGTCQVEVVLDNGDGNPKMLTIFDQRHVGAGDTVYQVVNQITRPAKITGKQDRRFDTTLLINGLPIIQIEEKSIGHDVNEALNQMHQYIKENQYSDIFSTVQILVGITPHDAKYMANTTANRFNKDFAFNWQREEDNMPVRNWKEFADEMLSIPMAHQMATDYMVLDGTKNNQMLKVMRPYQVYATKKIIDKLKKTDFEFGMNKIGYVWHTTGSGKTITSFKTAWLASRLPNVEKVVFVVDRIALTTQTNDEYRAYDPELSDDKKSSSKEEYGIVSDTEKTRDLIRQLKEKKNTSIIVTSVQKLDTLVNKENFKAPDKNIVFIVDEAHRSTGGKSFKAIQKAFKRSAWVGYTGTPMFDETTKGLRTEDIFGELLHAYTIKEAIADKNVLGFKVDFETTIDEKEMKEKYLPEFYREKYPNWSDKKIEDKINNLTQEDMDDSVSSSFYDENIKHIKLVVEDIFKNWRNRSNDGRYNAILTTKVGGGKPSTPMAMMYFREFLRVNELREKEGKSTLKVGITFSENTSNSDNMAENNEGLFEAIKHYNKQFGTSFDMKTVKEYREDLETRLNKKADDNNFLDLVIVVDQLLTGFNAKELNTLYVDRTLKGAGLIQAYSRTNRVIDMQEKPWGRIVNYRWPANNEKLMNKALAIYANKDSSKLTEREQKEQNEIDGITAKDFVTMFNEVKEVVDDLADMTKGFDLVPPSESKKEEMLHLLRSYNSGIAKLKQYDAPKIIARDGINISAEIVENNSNKLEETVSSDSSNEIAKFLLDGDVNEMVETDRTDIKSMGDSTDIEFDVEKFGFDYDNPEKLIENLGMTVEEEARLTTTLANELKKDLARIKKVPIIEIELKMSHIKDVKINYDYLTELIENLLNAVHDDKEQETKETQEKIVQFANGLEDRNYAEKIVNATDMIVKGYYPTPEMNFTYPAKLKNSDEVIVQANNISTNRMIFEFNEQWGITEIISVRKFKTWISNHRYGRYDLDDAGELSEIIKEASREYKTSAMSDEIRALSKIKYRNKLRDAIYQFADDFVRK